jgi:hypothetical protein
MRFQRVYSLATYLLHPLFLVDHLLHRIRLPGDGHPRHDLHDGVGAQVTSWTRKLKSLIVNYIHFVTINSFILHVPRELVSSAAPSGAVQENQWCWALRPRLPTETLHPCFLCAKREYIVSVNSKQLNCNKITSSLGSSW